MANWASVSYRIKGSKENLNKIASVIDDFVNGKVKPVRADADSNWEGNIVKVLGASEEDMKRYLRGFIQDYDIEEDCLNIEAEEAWENTDFREVLSKLMPDLKIYFYIEESGCGIYATNDKDCLFFSDRYYVDAEIKADSFSDYFGSQEDAEKYISALIGDGKVSHTEDEIQKWNEEHQDEDSAIYLHKIEIID